MGLIDLGARPTFRATVDGRDISGLFAPRLLSLSVSDRTGLESDEVSIRLDCGGAGVATPRTGAELRIWLGYAPAARFMGRFIVDEVSLEGPPDVMSIRGRAAPVSASSSGFAPISGQRSRSIAAGTTAGDLVSKLAGELGLEPGVSASLSGVALPHLDQLAESNVSLLSRVARDLDGIAKVGDGRLILARRGESLTLSGKAIPPVSIAKSDVSRWSCVISDREPAGTVVAVCRDLGTGEEVEVVAGDGDPVHRLRHTFPDREAARRAADAALARSSRAGQAVRLDMPGRPDVVAEGGIDLSGFVPAVNGSWLVISVDHVLDGSGGFSTSIRAEPFT